MLLSDRSWAWSSSCAMCALHYSLCDTQQFLLRKPGMFLLTTSSEWLINWLITFGCLSHQSCQNHCLMNRMYFTDSWNNKCQYFEGVVRWAMEILWFTRSEGKIVLKQFTLRLYTTWNIDDPSERSWTLIVTGQICSKNLASVVWVWGTVSVSDPEVGGIGLR